MPRLFRRASPRHRAGGIMTVKEIVKNYLENNGFHGLCSDECGCELNDLFPCNGDCSVEGCEPAFQVMCDRTDCKDCEICCGGWDDTKWRMETR